MARKDFRPKDKPVKPAGGGGGRAGVGGGRAGGRPSGGPSEGSFARKPAQQPQQPQQQQQQQQRQKQKPQQQRRADDNDADEDSGMDDDQMLAEIAALGGDKDDLDLIKDVRKSASSAVPADDDPSLKSDIQSFLSHLNLPSVAPRSPPVVPKPGPGPVVKPAPAPKTADKVKSAPVPTPKPAPAPISKPAPAPISKPAPAPVVKPAPAPKIKNAEKVKSAPAPKIAEKVKSAPAPKIVADKPIPKPAPPAPFVEKVIFKPAPPSQLGADSARSEHDGLSLQVTPLWSQTSLPKLDVAPPSSEKSRRKAKAANLVIPHAALSDEHIAALEQRASKLLERENTIYARMFEAEATGNVNHKNSLAAAGSNIPASDARFIRSLLSTSGEGGTLSDRISALTLLLQSSPLHNLRSLENLMAMVRKKNREESGRASRALSDWFASASGLPSQRKLRYFRDQDGLANVAFVLSDPNPTKDRIAAAEKHLLVFAFEHRLKTAFFEFLLLLEARSHDTLAFARTSAVIQISNLLSGKPEQEQNLLRLLVNKLGDGERSVASKASNALLELLNSHPFMKSIVVREVADLVLKPAASNTATIAPASQSNTNGASKVASAEAKKYNSHARYYGVLTLNQTMITSKDRESGLSNALVNLYFELFEGILEDLDSGRASGNGAGGKEQKLTVGGEVKEAEDDDDEEEESAQPKQKNRWRDQGGKRRKKGKQQQTSNGGKEINAVVKDAEAKIVAALLTGVRRAMPFATLETAVFERHIDTLFRITHSGTFNISIQALQLIFQVCTSVPGGNASGGAESTFTTSTTLADRYYRALYASLIDQRLEETSKQAMYLNLLFKSMKVDALAPVQEEKDAENLQVERLKAFSKRLVQVVGHHQPPFICGALFMLGELCKLSAPLRDLLTAPAPPENTYDGHKREPRFAHAGSACLWELLPLLTHYHPSVALHAHQLLEGTPISATADLNTSSLSHFLDRFVFRNPKIKAPTAKGASIMQPGFGTGTGSMTAGVGVDDVNVVNLKGRGVAKDEDVTNPKFWKKDRDDVPVDQVFFHQYFQQKQARAKGPGVSAADKSEPNDDAAEEGASLDADAMEKDVAEQSDAGSGEVLDEDEVDEDEIWGAIVGNLPKAGELDGLEDSGDSEDESEDGSAGFNADDFSDDEELDAMLGRGGADDKSDLEGDEDVDEADGMDLEAEDDDDESLDIELLEDDDDLISLDGDLDSDDDDDDDDEDRSESATAPGVAPTSAKRKDKRKRGAEEEEEEEEAAQPSAKLSNREKRAEKKKRKALPTFASADDYAHLLDSDDEEGA